MIDPFKRNNKETLTMAAMRNYIYHGGSIEDVIEDMSRVRYIKRLLQRRFVDGYLKHNLIINHLITMFNVFHQQFVVNILNDSCNSEEWIIINTYLKFMRRTTDFINVDDGLLDEIANSI